MDQTQGGENHDKVPEAELLQMFNEAAAQLTEADRAEIERLVDAFDRRSERDSENSTPDPDDN